jgi:hypothetical protein
MEMADASRGTMIAGAAVGGRRGAYRADSGVYDWGFLWDEYLHVCLNLD